MTPVPQSALESHVRRFFSGRTCVVRRWPVGPTSELWPDFYVLHVQPDTASTPHVFVSIGAANLGEGRHREFVLLTSEDGEHHVETLFMTAYYHSTEGLDVGHTFPVGRPWCPGGACDHFLVSLPYSLGPTFERITYGEHEVRILWLLPVYESEVAYRRTHGLEALEKLFDSAAFNIYDIRRRAVV